MKDAIIELAQSEIGYLEKSKSDYELYGSDCLYPKIKFAGADNYTKYSWELRTAGLGHPNGQPWCMTFLVWVIWTIEGTDLANKLLCGMIRSASTMDTKDAMIKAGRQVPLNTAQAGDLVFRSRSGGGHVGLVIGRSSDGKIITVEGNTSATDSTAWNGGCVAKHVGGSWEWCCRPDWSLTNPEVWRWVEVNGIWYYQNQCGDNKHGWELIKESNGDFFHWYFFNTKGQMLTGMQWVGDYLCLFQPIGALKGALCVTDDKGYQHPWNVEKT